MFAERFQLAKLLNLHEDVSGQSDTTSGLLSMCESYVYGCFCFMRSVRELVG